MMSWTPEMDAAVKSGFDEGLSARLIGERLGVTRNSVLGRTFRLGLCQPAGQPRQPKQTAGRPRIAKPAQQPGEKKRHTTLTRLSMELNASPSQIVEHISDLRDLGYTWQQIGNNYGLNAQTIIKWATEHGNYEPRTIRYFSEDELAYICDAWTKNVPVEDMADHLNRSFGVIRQTILRLRQKGEIAGRDPAKTRLLRLYGEKALAAGSTPAEALRKMNEAKQVALAAAMNASREAKRKHHTRALEKLQADIESGADRDAAIFACRAEGVSLEDIGQSINVTRERIRQICNRYASDIALAGFTAHQN